MKNGKINQASAQALIAVIIMMAVVLTLGVSLLFYARSFRNFSALQKDYEAAYSLAKAGMSANHYGLHYFPCSGYSSDGTYSLGTGDVAISVVKGLGDFDGRYYINSDLSSAANADRSTQSFEETINALALEGWAKTYPLSDLHSSSMKFEPTADGGFAIAAQAGSTAFNANTDFVLIKIDSKGEFEWAKRYQTAGREQLRAFRQAFDGGFVLAGIYDPLPLPSPVNTDIVVLKVDANGNFVWCNKYRGDNLPPGSSDDVDVVSCLQPISMETSPAVTKRGYVLGGASNSFNGASTNYDYIMIAIDEDGNLWDVFGSAGSRTPAMRYALSTGVFIYLTWVEQTVDSGFVMGGYLANDWLMIKTDKEGKMSGGAGKTWAHSFQSGSFGVTSFQKFVELFDTGSDPSHQIGYLCLGKTNSIPYNATLLFRLDSNGDVVWAKTYDGSITINNLQQTFDGGYALAGYTNQFGATGYDFFLIKTDGQGGLGSDGAWVRIYGGDGGDMLYGMHHTADKGYLLGGSSTTFGSHIFALKTNKDGFLSCCDQYNNDASPFPVVTSRTLTSVDKTIVENQIDDATGDLIRETVNSSDITVQDLNHSETHRCPPYFAHAEP